MTKEGPKVYYKVEMIRGEPWQTICSVLKKMQKEDFKLVFPGEELEYDPSEVIPCSHKTPDEVGRKREYGLTRKGVCESNNTPDLCVTQDYLDFFDYKIPKLGEEE